MEYDKKSISKSLTVAYLMFSLVVTLATSQYSPSTDPPSRFQKVNTYFQIEENCLGYMDGGSHGPSSIKLHVEYFRTDCSNNQISESLPNECSHSNRNYNNLDGNHQPIPSLEYVDYSHPNIVSIISDQGVPMETQSVLHSFEQRMGFELEELLKYEVLRSSISTQDGERYCFLQNISYLPISLEQNHPFYQPSNSVFDVYKTTLRMDQFECSTRIDPSNTCGLVVKEIVPIH